MTIEERLSQLATDLEQATTDVERGWWCRFCAWWMDCWLLETPTGLAVVWLTVLAALATAWGAVHGLVAALEALGL